MHSRKPDKKQIRKIRWIIMKGSFHDKMKSEIVSNMNRIEVMGQIHEPISVHLVPDIERGEVLLDSRATGSLQKQDEPSSSDLINEEKIEQ
jgi:hypothetical protein